MRQRMMKAGVLLLGLMILFTIISRTAYNMSTAQVSTKKPEPQTFTPDVSARGTVTGREEIAVSAEESLRVKTVHVTEGQAVEAGQLLFEVDLQDLMEKMKEKQQELYSLDLQIQGAAESVAFSEKSRQLILSQAQEDYNRTAARENAAVDGAQAELRQAQEVYQNFIAGSSQTGAAELYSGSSNSDQAGVVQPDSNQTAEELLAAVQEKQAAFDQAVQTRDESLYQAQKALDSANLGEAKDYSVEQSRITRGQKEEEIARLQALMDVQGRVTAPSKGMVTEVGVKAGSTTSGGGDILLSDLSGGASLTVTFSEDMRKYIREGTQAVVTAENALPGQQAAAERVTIQTIADSNMSGSAAGGMEAGAAATQQPGGSFRVTVHLSSELFSAGEPAVLKVEAQVSDYDSCVLAEALHLMSGDQYYVNVAEKRSTILGEEWVVRQVSVKLLEKNETYAAVEGISSGQEVITESSRTLEEGSRVKVDHETD
ncbi:MAG: biotin/lipoyl-binding protein [Ruminococcus sp.]|uniref:Biotin/lipoyl-binding protein n=1 Tax=Schaedlerella arabinosiphila TaxID=2044587 RepID=A0A3R8LIM7_9FIRM|nr:biotin/lipoyl-binding protein [Schaedlerella arabinosiphila]MCI8723921.1 biotin/lipoyl-binding protein [Ruminococcus sp.]RRK34129.1 biotin/lipoyl-binding protein [Schaedlerella arabinosiphila]